MLRISLALLAAACALAAEPPPEEREFFEKRIRPVLSEACFECHSVGAKKLKGGLMLDSPEALLKGGDTGPAIVAGDVGKSLLLTAIRWEDPDLQMPPKKRLAPGQVADLEAWIKAGAQWPRETAAKTAATKVFDLQKRKQAHWCWQPVRDDVARESVDRFLLAKLEEKKLKAAPPADARTLIRRLTFDLTGLPPTPEEVESFVHCSHSSHSSHSSHGSDGSDASDASYERLVDRLLASPHFGERWARHWLDVVRYAESRGHEFDPDIPNAWQYRDYVIRALNDDVPYDRFAAEHIAGDLLPARLDARTGANESILGTGFWFLGEEMHSPVDIRQDETDRIDNRLDTMSKAFLGLTVACARCHDHKFDAISQRDYYALAGVLIGSGYRQARFETMEAHRGIARELDALRTAARPRLLRAFAEAVRPGVARLAESLLAAREVLHGATAPWAAELRRAKGDPHDPLQAFAVIAAEMSGDDPAEFAHAFTPLLGEWEKRQAGEAIAPEKIVVDYSRADPKTWMQDGVSFGPRPLRAGDALFGSTPEQPLLSIVTRAAAERDAVWKKISVTAGELDYGKLGLWERSGQTLRTPECTLTEPRLWYLARGSGRAYAVVNSHLLIQGLHASLLLEWKGDGPRWQWIEHKLADYQGHRLHVEFSPGADGELAVATVVQSAERPPLADAPNALLLAAFEEESVSSPRTLAAATQRALAGACERMAADTITGADCAELADWLVRQLDLLCPSGSAERAQLAFSVQSFIDRQSAITERICPDSQTAPAMLDGDGVDEFVLVRGQSKSPGAPVPRRFLEAIAGPDQPEIEAGSGRRELARQIVDPANPLTARVFVNRVWHHLFGRGLVPTMDNFGALGQPPSHPELLDHLAHRFMHEQGWSVKKLIRELVLTRAYQMASHPLDAAAEEADPENVLLHRMNVRRLEAEAIRDAILAVSGRLDPQLGGPSVPVHLTEFMEGRGKPKSDGPLDGAGRRSIYTAVRRNFLSPMMLAFDAPVPFAAMGRRNVSNVPAQALLLMNDPFVVEQAKVWAHRLRDGEVDRRVTQMVLTAFSRTPSAEEIADARRFLHEQAALYTAKDLCDERAWADFAHVLFNAKEFIYLD